MIEDDIANALERIVERIEGMERRIEETLEAAGARQSAQQLRVSGGN